MLTKGDRREISLRFITVNPQKPFRALSPLRYQHMKDSNKKIPSLSHPLGNSVTFLQNVLLECLRLMSENIFLELGIIYLRPSNFSNVSIYPEAFILEHVRQDLVTKGNVTKRIKHL